MLVTGASTKGMEQQCSADRRVEICACMSLLQEEAEPEGVRAGQGRSGRAAGGRGADVRELPPVLARQGRGPGRVRRPHAGARAGGGREGVRGRYAAQHRPAALIHQQVAGGRSGETTMELCTVLKVLRLYFR